MTWLQALVQGIVEGLTEYLPVSSTGHIILAQRATGIAASEAADAYAICIQAGAILAVLVLYAGRMRQMGRGLLGRDADGFRLAVRVLIAFLPAAVVGLLVGSLVKQHLFGLWPVVAAWLVGGLAILALSRWYRPGKAGLELRQLTVLGAVVIGLAQCLAMWPGTSRSLVTILGGLLVGLSVEAAVEFSFLLGVVTLLAATAHDGYKHGSAMLEAYSPFSLVIGFIAAALAAAVAVTWMVRYLQRHGLQIFGYYRVALAVVVAALILTGNLVAK